MGILIFRLNSFVIIIFFFSLDRKYKIITLINLNDEGTQQKMMFFKNLGEPKI